MKDHFGRSLRRFARDSEGATMIEFAFIFPIILLLTFGIMEISLYMVSLVTLEGGLKEASRYGITSQDPGSISPADLLQVPIPFKTAPTDTRREQIGLILNQYTLNTIDLDQAQVDTKTYNSFILIRDGEPYSDNNGNGVRDAGEPFSDIACPHNGVYDGPGVSSGNTAGAAGAIVVYTITYNWRVMTPIVGQWLGKPDPGNPGRYIMPMKAVMVVKNEPSLSGSTFGC